MEASTKDIIPQAGDVIKTKFELATEAQVEKVQNRRHYKTLFYDPMPNNFSLVLVNKDLVLDEYIDRYSESLRQFNVVNYNLYRLCELKFDEVEWIDEKHEKDARHALTKWQKLINAGNSFLCFQYVSYVVNAFKQNHYPILRVLREPRYSLVLDKLTSIDLWVKSFFKMGLYLDFGSFYGKFDDFLAELTKHRSLRNAIDKLEVAREYFPSDQKQPKGNQVALSVFFNPDLVQKPQDEMIARISQLMTQIFLSDNAPPVEDESDFIQMIRPNICLAQGFKSYKKYLSLVGAIDDIYDSQSRYAYLKQ